MNTPTEEDIFRCAAQIGIAWYKHGKPNGIPVPLSGFDDSGIQDARLNDLWVTAFEAGVATAHSQELGD